MKVTILGSGTTIPHPLRSSAGIWLETTGGNVMLDFSAPMPLRMAQEGLPWHELDVIWISHFHIDHCAGLLPFLAGTKHAPQTRDREKPLVVCGPHGLEALVLKFSEVNKYKLLEQPFPVNVVEVAHNEKFELLPGVEAVALKTPHTDESHAIRITDEGKSLVYSSDTGFDEVLATFAHEAEMLILECSYVRDKPKIKHLELAEAVYIIRKAKVKEVMLTHLYPEWDGVDMIAEIRRMDPFMNNVTEAKDGLRRSI